MVEDLGVVGSNPTVPTWVVSQQLIKLGIGRKWLQTQSSECEMERAKSK